MSAGVLEALGFAPGPYAHVKLTWTRDYGEEEGEIHVVAERGGPEENDNADRLFGLSARTLFPEEVNHLNRLSESEAVYRWSTLLPHPAQEAPNRHTLNVIELTLDRRPDRASVLTVGFEGRGHAQPRDAHILQRFDMVLGSTVLEKGGETVLQTQRVMDLRVGFWAGELMYRESEMARTLGGEDGGGR